MTIKLKINTGFKYDILFMYTCKALHSVTEVFYLCDATFKIHECPGDVARQSICCSQQKFEIRISCVRATILIDVYVAFQSTIWAVGNSKLMFDLSCSVP